MPSDSPCHDKHNFSKDHFIRIHDKHVGIGYALHPPYYWKPHAHGRHQFILMLDECSHAEFAWHTPNGSQGKRNLTGQYLCFIEKNLAHSFRWNTSAALVSLYISEAFMAQTSPERNCRDVFIYHWSEILRYDLLTLGLVMFMAELCRQHDRMHSVHLQATAILLSAQLIRLHARKKVRVQKSAGLESAQMERVQMWIDNHISGRMEVREMARVAGVSRSYFGRKFKATTGYTPRRYILIQRVHLGLRLLQRGDMRMSEIAAAAGFSDQSHMSRRLREFYGRLLSNKGGQSTS
ncbi:AraC family transcriptional regulator [Ereboglobus sp. PH5-10]|uniref:helix-turn-helix domain-containing protein n=1 Tax=Ereboglobus sp. PH5-10 TaxID=2940629 RepID=UPI0024075057|nr:AraC family transcriptional regulator [Ereboglobus sp. PH5-10]MDF9827046.1 AraC family transcriptional regulator [Ereboglobus sp. PH5-10]